MNRIKRLHSEQAFIMQKHDFFIFPDTIRPNNYNARVSKLPPVLQLPLPKGGADGRMSQQLCGRLVRYAATKRIPVEKPQYRGKEAHTAPLPSCAIALTYFTLTSTLIDVEIYRCKTSFHVCLSLQRELFPLYSSVVFAILLHCL